MPVLCVISLIPDIKYKTMNTVNYLLFFLLSVFIFPAGLYGQCVKKITLENVGNLSVTSTYAVIFGEGMPETAYWPLGKRLTWDDRTVRHGVSGGYGDNLNINSRVAFRFIVAPEDAPVSAADATKMMTWLQACGSDGGSLDIVPKVAFSGLVATGCAAYNHGGRKWRIPTQRELQLMWVLRDGIRYAYTGVSGASPMGTHRYWSSTEEPPVGTVYNAWIFDFSATFPRSHPSDKTGYVYVRCVSDY